MSEIFRGIRMHKHIIFGLTPAAALRRYLREPLENFAVFEDSFILGPLSSISDLNKFISGREQFWKNYSLNDDGFIGYALREFVGQIEKAESFTLWICPSAHDQILWSWLVHLFDHYNKDWSSVTVKHLFNKADSEFPYITLGELRPEDFSLCKDFIVEDAHIDFLRDAYTALQSSDPKVLLELCNMDICPLPELQQSLRAYLKLFPDVKTGLTICQKALLSECTERQLKSARIVGGAMMFDEYDNRFAIGDQYLFTALINMSQRHSKQPLINFVGKVKSGHSMRWTEVSITALGKKVLAGEANNIQLNGIDMHIGGVHLDSNVSDRLWFYDGETLVSKT